MIRSSIPTTISVTEVIDPECGTVLADPTQIHQILMNLCSNAAHAMQKKGGQLAVELQPVIIPAGEKEIASSPAAGAYVKLTVLDTGCGIPPDLIGKIFDPFFTTKDTGKGTGMGLAIIHGIVSEYGGTITVESQLGHGTSFHVYLPVVQKDTLSEKKEPEATSNGSKRILFVDDEELLAEVSKDMLEKLGCHVTVRRSGIEALATFVNNPEAFDLVITDQVMPGLTGADLARQLLKIRPELPIILCTGYSNLTDESSSKALGIKEVALKPLTKDLVAGLIRKLLVGQ